jgi:hypothetical protein
MSLRTGFANALKCYSFLISSYLFVPSLPLLLCSSFFAVGDRWQDKLAALESVGTRSQIRITGFSAAPSIYVHLVLVH